MQIGHIGSGCYCDAAERRAPADTRDSLRPDGARTDSGAGKGDKASLTAGALSVLSREIREVLSSEFYFRFRAAAGYGGGPSEAALLATDVKAAGKALLAASPLGARGSLEALRQRVQAVAGETRSTVGGSTDLDGAVAEIEDGLDELDGEAARNVASGASVLSYESKLRQRALIGIRTQEGDLVKIDLRRLETIQASDVAVSNGESALTETEIELSSRSRMVLKVNGDINEAEMAAIEAVFTQALEAADAFYGGDVAAAFDGLSGMEFDAEQLAGVRVRFRERLETNIAYAAIRSAEPAPVAAPSRELGPRMDVPVLDSAPPSVKETKPQAATPASADAEAVAAEEPEVAVPAEQTEAAVPAEPAVQADDPVDGLLGLLADFIKRANEGFELEGGSYRYYYSESFKLQLLKSVLEVSAPAEADAAVEAAGNVIDAVARTADGE